MTLCVRGKKESLFSSILHFSDYSEVEHLSANFIRTSCRLFHLISSCSLNKSSIVLEYPPLFNVYLGKFEEAGSYLAEGSLSSETLDSTASPLLLSSVSDFLSPHALMSISAFSTRGLWYFQLLVEGGH